MKKIELLLRHNSNEDEFFKLVLLPADTKIGHKWFNNVKLATKNKKLLEKEMAFFGWIHSPFNLPKLGQLINHHIDIINEASFRLNWDRKPFIQNKIDLNKLDQAALNEAHHQFELLIGQFWENAGYYKQADKQLRYSIHRLNSLVHEIESFIDTLNYAKKDPKSSIASVRLNYNDIERELLEPEDYIHFTTDLVFGDINLGYCQSGKTHVEAWYDNDEFIQDNNVNGLRYHSADTIINFVSARQPIPGKTKEFHDWLISKGVKDLKPTYFIDDNGQYQGLGWLRVGKIDTKPFDHLSTPEIQKLLGNFQDIYQLTCIDGEEVVSNLFVERRGSEELRKKITSEL